MFALSLQTFISLGLKSWTPGSLLYCEKLEVRRDKGVVIDALTALHQSLWWHIFASINTFNHDFISLIQINFNWLGYSFIEYRSEKNWSPSLVPINGSDAKYRHNNASYLHILGSFVRTCLFFRWSCEILEITWLRFMARFSWTFLSFLWICVHVSWTMKAHRQFQNNNFIGSLS